MTTNSTTSADCTAYAAALPSVAKAAPCCQGKNSTGIFCDSSNTFITSVILESFGLSGPVPPVFQNFSSLQTLDLRSNYLTGEIPSWLNNLKSLDYLDLSDNSLSGTIPSFLGSLKLTFCDLCCNKFTGTIPTSFSSSVSLTALSFAANELTGKVPDLSGLRKLNDLRLGNNFYDPQTVPTWLGNLPNLQALQFSSGQFYGPIPDNLGTLTGLTQLFMDNNNLTGPLPSSFANLKSLKTLQAKGNLLSGAIPTGLASISTLTTLDLSGNCFDQTVPSSLLSKFPNAFTNSQSACDAIAKSQNGSATLPPSTSSSTGFPIGGIVGIVAGVVVVIAVVIAVVFFNRRKKSGQDVKTEHYAPQAASQPPAFLVNENIPAAAQIPPAPVSPGASAYNYNYNAQYNSLSQPYQNAPLVYNSSGPIQFNSQSTYAPQTPTQALSPGGPVPPSRTTSAAVPAAASMAPSSPGSSFAYPNVSVTPTVLSPAGEEWSNKTDEFYRAKGYTEEQIANIRSNRRSALFSNVSTTFPSSASSSGSYYSPATPASMPATQITVPLTMSGNAAAAELLRVNAFPPQTVDAFAARSVSVDQLVTVNPDSLDLLENEYFLHDPKLKLRLGELIKAAKAQLEQQQQQGGFATLGRGADLPGYVP